MVNRKKTVCVIGAVCALFYSAVLASADPSAVADAQKYYLQSAILAYSNTLHLTDQQKQEVEKAFSGYLHKDLMPVLAKLQLTEKWSDMQRDTQFRELTNAYLTKKTRKEKFAILKELKRLQKDYYPELEQIQTDPAMKTAARKLQQKLNQILKQNTN